MIVYSARSEKEHGAGNRTSRIESGSDILGSLSGYEDSRLAIRERFLTPELGGARTIGLITEPRESPATSGWVVCHSFGPEYEDMAAFDAMLARRLATEGFATLRFLVQGYGDSELGTEHVTVAGHVLSAVEAAALLTEISGVSSIGFIGARFGATVAALAAHRAEAAAMALIDPVIKGRVFLRSLVRLDLTAGLSERRRVQSSVEDPWRTLERRGVLEVNGFPLGRDVVAEIEAIDLPVSLSSFMGPSLVLQVSRSEAPRPDLESLVHRLSDIGGRPEHVIAVDPNALRFGLPPWRIQGVGKKVNVLDNLTTAILAKAIPWCVESLPKRRN